MAYYIVVDDEPEFQRIEGPYRTQWAVIDSLTARGIYVFTTKREAREYIES